MTTLYNLTKQDAATLVDYAGGNIALLGLILWNTGRATDIDRGVYKARKLVKFSQGAQ
jgi:hypothetical protein